jgi:NADPH:quinone reductase-like Zn-dependent oxidoreductase
MFYRWFRGVVRPVIDRVYPAEEVRAAHQQVESNRSCGKVVLDFSV